MLIEESNDLSVQTFHIESLKRMSNRLFQNAKMRLKIYSPIHNDKNNKIKKSQ